MLNALFILFCVGVAWALFKGNMFYLRYFYNRKWHQGVWHLIAWRGQKIQDTLFPWWERPDPYPQRAIGNRRLNDGRTIETVFWKPTTRRHKIRLALEDLGLLERRQYKDPDDSEESGE